MFRMDQSSSSDQNRPPTGYSHPRTEGSMASGHSGCISRGGFQIHLAKYIHYDLKPSNLLFSDGNSPLVADFGQTMMIGPSGTSSLPGLYPGSLPPEYLTTGIGTVETDVYHAGVTIYRAVNG